MELLGLILPALLPPVADGIKGVFQKLFGGTKPITVDDQVKLMQMEIEKLKAISELDNPRGEISRWVADLRASFRYIAAGVIILSTAFLSVVYVLAGVYGNTQGLSTVYELLELMLMLSGSVFSFMFGDRVYLSLRGRR